MLPEFQAFSKIPRLNRPVVITEKIDGTNAQIHITDDGEVLAGSRKRWITPEADNFGFARWVKDHEDELRSGLGFGTHYGEWWGSGIQRGYGLEKGEKRFSLFNTDRWSDDSVRPECCSVVPVMVDFTLPYDSGDGFPPPDIENIAFHITECISILQKNGSYAAPGFMDPEGIVIFHTASNHLYKVTVKGDEKPKGSNE